ncbi:4-oxalomesaconate tautomerase [Gilvimarinus sp. F26214L]|uniref:4-oxalomesaconate tautomerase n=1 Tax=Gilvimarinus sp. DZF01 TaxID=3461371 RepID=UPI00404662AE
MQRAIPCTIMRGGTSKGLYFLASDLPGDPQARNALLMRALGSPDERQIDGMGGAHPLTSKVAVVSPSEHPDADVDYLFLQVQVDRPEVSDAQTCGNLLAGVGPFAIEKGLVSVINDVTHVRIRMLNTGSIAVAQVQTPEGRVNYEGEARIDGVPGTAAPVMLDFLDVAGSSCGALLPSGNTVDSIDNVLVTCVDNGMPAVVLSAEDLGKSGYESPAELEADGKLRRRLESIRLEAGRLMNLGDVANKSVPKLSLVAPARDGGLICTRTFIPHRVHEAIGVLGAVSVATACMLPGSVAQQVIGKQLNGGVQRLDVEHPTGFFTVEMDCAIGSDSVQVRRSALLRTARKLMEGDVFIPASTGSKP